MVKFELRDNEELLFKENYVNYHKVLYKVGTAYLTSERFVFCVPSFSSFLLLGPIFHIFLPNHKKIYFEFPLKNLTSFEEEKTFSRSYLTLKLKNGAAYKILFPSHDKWLNIFKKILKK